MSGLKFDLFDISVGNNQSVLLLSPVVPDDAAPAVKDGLTARRLASITGECPTCHGQWHSPNRAARRAAKRKHRTLVADCVHENWCPAVGDPTVSYMRNLGC